MFELTRQHRLSGVDAACLDACSVFCFGLLVVIVAGLIPHV